MYPEPSLAHSLGGLTPRPTGGERYQRPCAVAGPVEVTLARTDSWHHQRNLNYFWESIGLYNPLVLQIRLETVFMPKVMSNRFRE
jgi:hypothetical protein